ncbi:helix-turn-helix domain-containing protein [Alistipes sp. OttesenSCG-928-B03]|nr:helix-turn-helix domain-containing protein [Alistipes sp. OttesenSCG-928-B03]
MNVEERVTALEIGLKMAGLASKEVLTFEEAAAYTGLSKSYLYKLTSTKKVPHYKSGGKMVHFSRPELEAWLLSRRVDTTDEITAKAQIHCLTTKKGGRK